ncbi:MAG: hypothetical protein H7A50_04675 [Akkermansiaceae bacterium]|nr:hypothetical protein [Akkermansiaceae bacterium]
MAAVIGDLRIEVRTQPVWIGVKRADVTLVQELDVHDDGTVSTRLGDQPVLGLGEGGPRPTKGVDWRKASVEFDRRGRLHAIEPRWQTDAYGSRNPVALLTGTKGWGLCFASPWGRIDLTGREAGVFIPVGRKDPAEMRQSFANQREQPGKGIPPMETIVPGLLDVFVFDALDPAGKPFIGKPGIPIKDEGTAVALSVPPGRRVFR